MAYNTALNSVYNHYLTAYAPKGTTAFDTHKKSELRSIYNSIVKLNKESPLFKLDNSKTSQEFAISLKENARQLRNTIASLGGLNEEEMLNKKAAFSSDDNMVTASFIGEAAGQEPLPAFDIEVRKLASEQVNLGTFLPASGKTTLKPDTYSFDVSISGLNYEFQFAIHEDETNSDIQSRLARLINNADIGLTCNVTGDGQGNSALKLTSNATGAPSQHEDLFRVTDEQTSMAAGAVAYLGLDYVARKASNAGFLLNGEERTALSNHFTVGKMFEISLNGVSSIDGQSAHVGLKTDTESLMENIRNLISGYNSFVDASAGYSDGNPKSRQLLNEIKGIGRLYQNDFDALGLYLMDNGSISLDEDQFQASVISDDQIGSLSIIKDFTNSILRKTGQISLDPMQYVNKTIVAYKNPGHNFATPYVASAYSGMMFNSYC